VKDLMNKVTEAKNAAEANLTVRRDQPSVGARPRPYYFADGEPPEGFTKDSHHGI